MWQERICLGIQSLFASGPLCKSGQIWHGLKVHIIWWPNWIGPDGLGPSSQLVPLIDWEAKAEWKERFTMEKVCVPCLPRALWMENFNSSALLMCHTAQTMCCVTLQCWSERQEYLCESELTPVPEPFPLWQPLPNPASLQATEGLWDHWGHLFSQVTGIALPHVP